MTKHDLTPVVTPRFTFKFQGNQFAICHFQLAPKTSPVTTVMAACPCGRADCTQPWQPVAAGPMEAMALMGTALNLLLDERDERDAQQKPGVN